MWCLDKKEKSLIYIVLTVVLVLVIFVLGIMVTCIVGPGIVHCLTPLYETGHTCESIHGAIPFP